MASLTNETWILLQTLYSKVMVTFAVHPGRVYVTVLEIFHNMFILFTSLAWLDPFFQGLQIIDILSTAPNRCVFMPLKLLHCHVWYGKVHVVA